MDLLREKLRCTPMGAGLRKGSKTANSSATTTSNHDARNAVQDGVGVSGSFNRVEYNSTDAVVAMTEAGADVLKNAGGAIVDLNRDSLQASSKNFDAVVTAGASLVDKLIDASVQTTKTGSALATEAVQSFKPTENANADVAKYAAIAAAVVAGVVLMKGSK